MKIPDSLKDSISSKVLGKSGASKVSSSSDALKSINSITDNFNFLPKIAKSLNITRQNIFKLVKLEGGKPVKADNNSDSKDIKIPTLELKTKILTKYPEKKLLLYLSTTADDEKKNMAIRLQSQEGG